MLGQRDFSKVHTLINRNWLDYRFSNVDDAEGYLSHEPIYGAGCGRTEGGHARRILRLHDVLVLLRDLGVGPGHSVIDIGGAEGYLSHLVRKHLGSKVTTLDLSSMASLRATQLFGVPSLAANASLLPFPNQAFDVVLITEVIEHVIDPMSALLECQRIAKKFLVLTTEEWAESPRHREHVLAERNIQGHMERNVFCEEDLPHLFGKHPLIRGQQRFPKEEPDAATLRQNGAAAIMRICESPELHYYAGTVMAVSLDQKAAPLPKRPTRPVTDRSLIESMVAGGVPTTWRPQSTSAPVPASIGESVVCPLCLGALSEGFRCAGCAWAATTTPVLDAFAYRPNRENLEITAKRHALPPARIAALRALDEKFHLEPRLKTSWAGAELTVAEEWTLDGIEPRGGDQFMATTNDPQFISPFLGIPLADLAAIEVEMAIEGTHRDFIEVFFFTDRQYSFDASLSAGLWIESIRAGTVSIAIPDAVRQRGQHLVRFRLDPSCTPGTTFRILAVRLIPAKR